MDPSNTFHNFNDSFERQQLFPSLNHTFKAPKYLSRMQIKDSVKKNTWAFIHNLSERSSFI